MAKTKDNTTLVSRPRRKPDSSVRGKLNRWDNSDYCEFVPTGTGESKRNVLKQLGPSSFYKTEGQKESSYSIHVNVDGESADPIGEAFDIFKALTEGQRKSVPSLPEGEGRMLLDNGDGLQIWLDTEKGEVTIQARLACTPQIERMLLAAQAQMNVCIGRHRQEIVNLKPQSSNI